MYPVGGLLIVFPSSSFGFSIAPCEICYAFIIMAVVIINTITCLLFIFWGGFLPSDEPSNLGWRGGGQMLALYVT